MIDVNCTIGNWPFQEIMHVTPKRLTRHYGQSGVTGALVASADAVLFPDPDVPDDSHFKRLQRHPGLHPVKTINPGLAGWRASLDQYAGSTAAVKLYPNYHQYDLQDSEPDSLVSELEERGIPLLIAVRMEDERQHYPLMQVKPVPIDSIVAAAERHRSLNVIVLNAYFQEADKIGAGPENLAMDIACAEKPDTLSSLSKAVPPERILFGSHSPFFTLKAALNKMEFAAVSERDLSIISESNARRLIPALK